ncbi:T9SS type A sorting domain-containing protein [Constantimarinum furrinae]|uniref:T9SS type A sorting domain-containing protein n=1 Tax=Constantimarinum furrinae TaxID=2562285 RepID=UPI00164C1516|nr:T9SS type A sorting domain-containing protein [Constantimarinum furrinae]
MKKTIVLFVLIGLVGTLKMTAQFIVSPQFIETTGVSNDGLVVGYVSQAGPYTLWDPETNTYTEIGGAAPGQGIGGSARFSADGVYISGTTLEDIGGTVYSIKSMYNTTTQQWTSLGSLNYSIDDNLSSGYNISADGQTVVGSAYVEPTPGQSGVAVHATAWTASSGMIDLGSLYTNLNRSTRANAVSDDGEVIVGWQDFNGPWKAAVWRKDANGDFLPNEYLLVDPTGDPADEYNQLGEAVTVSGDGNWIGGKGDYANNDEPWIWSESTGYISLGTFPAGGKGTVMKINYDGTLAIGYFQIDPWTPNIPFIWTPTGGLQDFNDYITQTLGYSMGASPVYVPNGMSPNGKYIVGWGYDPTIGPWGDLFTFRLELPETPTNDECNAAIPVACGDTVMSNTLFATNSGGNASPDVYYSFTGDGSPQTISVSTCGTGTNFPTTVRIFSDCTLTNEIVFNDSSCQNQPELEFESDGTSTYYIMVEGYDSSASGSFQLTINCESILGTDEFNRHEIALYPNPVQDILNVSAREEISTVSIYGVSGAKINTYNFQQSSGQIDLSALAGGIYFVQISAGNQIETFKIIKE